METPQTSPGRQPWWRESVDHSPVSSTAVVLAVAGHVRRKADVAIHVPAPHDVGVVVTTVADHLHVGDAVRRREVEPPVVQALLREVSAIFLVPRHVHRVGGGRVAATCRGVRDLSDEGHLAAVRREGAEGIVTERGLPLDREVGGRPAQVQLGGPVAPFVGGGAVEVHHSFGSVRHGGGGGRHDDRTGRDLLSRDLLGRAVGRACEKSEHEHDETPEGGDRPRGFPAALMRRATWYSRPVAEVKDRFTACTELVLKWCEILTTYYSKNLEFCQ